MVKSQTNNKKIKNLSSNSNDKKNKQANWQKKIKSFLPFILIWLVVLITSATLTYILLQKNVATTTKTSSSTTSPSPTPTPKPEPLTFLLMGYGGGNHDGGKLSDSMIVARLNSEDKLLTLVSIPRDLWVPLPLNEGEKYWSKINAAYAIGSDSRGYSNRSEEFKGEHGGGNLAKKMVSEITGWPINYYLSVDFETFIRAIDTIGPLSVEVPYSFEDYFYPIRGKENDPCDYSEADIATITATYKDFELEKQFPCRYEHLKFTQGKTAMDGETALKFVRSRHSGTGGGDFGRSQRQQALIQAVLKQAFSLSFISKIPTLATQFSTLAQTDFPLSAITDFLPKIQAIQDYKIQSVTLTTENVLQNGRSGNRQYILRPLTGEGDWSGIQAHINQEIAKATTSAQLDSQDATSSAQMDKNKTVD